MSATTFTAAANRRFLLPANGLNLTPARQGLKPAYGQQWAHSRHRSTRP